MSHLQLFGSLAKAAYRLCFVSDRKQEKTKIEWSEHCWCFRTWRVCNSCCDHAHGKCARIGEYDIFDAGYLFINFGLLFEFGSTYTLQQRLCHRTLAHSKNDDTTKCNVQQINREVICCRLCMNFTCAAARSKAKSKHSKQINLWMCAVLLGFCIVIFTTIAFVFY